MSIMISVNAKVIGIVGTRSRDTEEDHKLVYKAFMKEYEEDNTVICSGRCPKGGDRFAELIGNAFGIPMILFPPAWTRFGVKAGFTRNTDIARISKDVLIACVAKNRKGGTEDTLRKHIGFHPNAKRILIEV